MIRAKLHLKSGQTVIVHAKKFTRDGAGNELASFSATGAVDYPLYLRLDDVSAIVTEKRGLFGWRQF